MSFYRTYRPQIISEIDNTVVRDQLLTLLHKDKKNLPHAYLFSGPKGTGKTTAARLVAKIFNCTKLSKREGPCGKCEQCRSIERGNNLDVLEMDAASNRGIDEIRTLREQISLAPVSGEYKIYIIDEVHMLTMEAFNALLKTLEEPPQHAVFVLATTDVHKVPGTIRSRCLSIVFSQASVSELIHALIRIVRKEKIAIDKDALTRIAETAEGSFRDATKMLEQVSFHRGKITASVVRTTLSLSEEILTDKFLELLAKRNAKDALRLVGVLMEKGHDVRSFLVDFLQKLERLLLEQTLGAKTDPWNSADIRESIRRFSQAFVEMKLSPIVQLPLELAIVEFCEDNVIRDTQDVIRDEEKESGAKLSGVAHIASHVSRTGMLTLEKLTEHWPDIIASLKSYNHSVAGVLRSARPKAVEHGIVTIEAFYTFHQEKLSEPKTKEVLSRTLKKLFGEKVKVEIVLGKK